MLDTPNGADSPYVDTAQLYLVENTIVAEQVVTPTCQETEAFIASFASFWRVPPADDVVICKLPTPCSTAERDVWGQVDAP